MTHIITGGSVTVEDGIKASTEYAPSRKVSVTLTFDAPETDAELTLDAVAALCDRKVKELLGKAVVPAKNAPAQPAKAEPVAEVPAAEPPKTPAKRGPKPKTDKDKIAEEAHGPLPETLAATQATADDLLGENASSEPASDTSSSDLLIEDPEPAKEITDGELNRIVTDHLEKFKTAPEAKRSEISMAIRKRMASHIGDGKPVQLRAVPQEHRNDFVQFVQSLK